MPAAQIPDSTSDPQPLPPDVVPGLPLVVRDTGSGYAPLSWVVPIEVRWYEGARPAEALMRYQVDELRQDRPSDFESILPSDAPGDVLRQDDRVGIVVYDAPGSAPRWLFDGFVEIPELGLSPRTQRLPVRAVSVAKRCWDTPLPGAAYRHASRFSTPAATVWTELPTRFNPRGRPNFTGEGYDYQDPDGWDPYPVFVDPEPPIPAAGRRPAYLHLAARYILGAGNAKQEYVDLPTAAYVDRVLKAVKLAAGKSSVDPADPSTYELVPIEVPDQELTDLPWPEALERLLSRHGFAFKFEIGTASGGGPRTWLTLYPKTDWFPVAERDLYLQKWGQVLDPSKSNTSAATLQRDAGSIVNRWTVRLAPTLTEVALVLAPGFDVSLAGTSPATYKKTKADTPGVQAPWVDPRVYRSWVFNETAEGYWNGTVFETGNDKIPDLNQVFPSPDIAERRRPAVARLVKKGDAGEVLRPRLAVLVEGANAASFKLPTSGAPGVWSPGTLTPCWVKGGWSLDPDRLGILLDCDDVNAWDMGGHATTKGFAGGKVRAIDWLKGINGSAQSQILLLLLCAIEDDTCARKWYPRPSASPTRFEVQRAVDARDRLAFELIHKSSPNYDPAKEWVVEGKGQGVSIYRDDREAAAADSLARQQGTAYARFAGGVAIPRLAYAYSVGCRLRKVAGREMSLRITPGTASTPAVYPRVVQRVWRFDPRQETVLHVDDDRADRDP